MNKLITIANWFLIGMIALAWLYVATRMIARGVMRSIQEWKERNKNG
jgi:hypothetical protein